MTIMLVLLFASAAIALGRSRSASDARAAQAVWSALRALHEKAPHRYDPAMVAGLPAIARRYFEFAIAPGTPLHRVVDLTMHGEFLLNGRALPMRAEQILAPPHGLVWRARIGRGLLRLSGSDGYHAGRTSWTSFWLLGIVPLARIRGGQDHARAAAARLAMESIWCPAALLPQHGAVWRQVAEHVAEIDFSTLPGIAPVRITFDDVGRPVELVTQRWSDANPERIWRLQPFGGRVLAYGEQQDFRVPFELEIGNGYGRADHVPFFRARISSLRYGGD